MEVIEPQLADQLTAGLKLPVPVTVAVNCCVAPEASVTGDGETETPVMELAIENVAPTDRSALIVTVQVPVPEQAPLQPLNV